MLAQNSVIYHDEKRINGEYLLRSDVHPSAGHSMLKVDIGIFDGENRVAVLEALHYGETLDLGYAWTLKKYRGKGLLRTRLKEILQIVEAINLRTNLVIATGVLYDGETNVVLDHYGFRPQEENFGIWQINLIELKKKLKIPTKT